MSASKTKLSTYVQQTPEAERTERKVSHSLVHSMENTYKGIYHIADEVQMLRYKSEECSN